MSDYGVTPTGFVKKRLDVITDEIQESLGKSFGFDLKANPKSYLNVLITDFSDKIAELWEVAEATYQNLYPSTAENESLDRVAQFGGCYREAPEASVYTVLCKGDNGTTLPVGTRLSTSTNPPIYLRSTEEGAISLDNCTEFYLETVGVVDTRYTYSVQIDSFPPVILEDSEIINSQNIVQNPLEKIYDKLKSDIDNGIYNSDDSLSNKDLYFVSFDTDGDVENTDSLHFKFANNVAHAVKISSALNVVDVVSPNNFATETAANITIPEGGVDTIAAAVSGLKSVYNLADYIKGRDRETDEELRNSYVEKIFIRSRTMLESIVSAIKQNCDGIESVTAYQNDTHVWRGIPETNEVKHMPPHSVEVVVQCAKNDELYQDIAEQIFATKAAGIQTCHHCGYSIKEGETAAGTEHLANSEYCIERTVEDDYGNPVTVRFSKPWPVELEVIVDVTPNGKDFPGVDIDEKIKEIVMDNINSLAPGEDVQPQQWIYKLYNTIPGVAKFDIWLVPIEQAFYDEYGEGDYITGIGYNRIASVDENAITINLS